MKIYFYILALPLFAFSATILAKSITFQGDEYDVFIEQMEKCKAAEEAAKKKESEPPKVEVKPEAPQVAKLNVNLHNLTGTDVYIVVRVKALETEYQYMEVQGMSKSEITTFASLYGKVNIKFDLIPVKDDKGNEHIARAQYRRGDGTVRNIDCKLLEQDADKKPSKSVDVFVSIRENESFPSCSVLYDYQP
jgi:hypothetical protein